MSSGTDRVNEWRKLHKDEWNEYQKNYQKEFRTHGVRILIKDVWRWIRVPGKRPKLSACELCGEPNDDLSYHHWTNRNLLLGMWLCRVCHSIVKHVESGLVDKYLQLKDKITKEVGDSVVDAEVQLRSRK